MYTEKQLNAMKKADVVKALLDMQIQLDAARLGVERKPAQPTNVTGRIVGNIVAGSPVYPQVQRFAEEHRVHHSKVVISGMRMEIRG